MNENVRKPSPFGIAAIVLGFVAFAGVVGHFFAGPIDPPPPIERSIADTAAAIRDATVAKLKGEEYEYEEASQARTLDDYLKYALLGTAGVAILMGIIGFVRHEGLRANAAGVSLGALAIAFEVAMMMFFVVMFVVLLSAVIDKLDFDFF